MSIFSWTANIVCKISLSQYQTCWTFDINNTSVFTSQPTVLLSISTKVMVEESSPSAPVTAEGFIIFHDHWLRAVEIEDHTQNVAQVARKVRLQLISNACWQREHLKPNQLLILRGAGWSFKTKGWIFTGPELLGCLCKLSFGRLLPQCLSSGITSPFVLSFFFSSSFLWHTYSFGISPITNLGCFTPKESKIEKSQAKNKTKQKFNSILNFNFILSSTGICHGNIFCCCY